MRRKIQIKQLLADVDNEKQLLAPNTWGDVNPCIFSEWACSDKSLRNKAINIATKLKFLVNEEIINDEDYVTFKNLQNVNNNYSHAIIIRKEKTGERVLGGWCFSKKTKTRHIASYWAGIDHQGAELPDRYTGYGSWRELKAELKKDNRPRLAAQEIFMSA
ncbi:MAG: hypothetical protein J6N72_08130 [Psychrobacter sp.]|nr:hypothetical protein [Psychrobacter sp.]